MLNSAKPTPRPPNKHRAQWLSDWRSLRTKQVNLEREIVSAWPKFGAIKDSVSNEDNQLMMGSQSQSLHDNLKNFWSQSKCHNQVEGRIFHNDFVQIHTSLRQLQALLHCPSFERPSNFVEQLEKHLMETEHFILSMKKRSKEEREKIIEAVRTLDVEVDSYYAKIQTWPELDRQLAQHQKTKSRVSHQWKQQDSYVLPEVLAYQDFITRYGPTGGWEEAQHITFVSVWNKLHHRKKAFMETMVSQTGICPEVIAKHEVWYVQLQALNSERKRALEQWKNQKMKQSAFSSHFYSVQQVNEEDQNETLKSKQGAKFDTVRDRKLEEKRLKQKEALAQWLHEKKIHKQIEREKMERNEVRMERRKAQEEMKRMETKKLVEEFKRVREELEMMEIIQEQERLQAEKHAHVDLKALRLKSEAEIEAIKKKRLEAEKEQAEREALQMRRITKLKEPIVKRIQSTSSRERILQPTVSLKFKRLKDTTGTVDRFFQPGRGSLGLRALPPVRILHQPSWRQGI